MTDDLTTASRFLAGNMEWARHWRFADELLADIQAAHRVMTGLIDGAPPRHYLGPCGAADLTNVAPTADADPVWREGQTCEGDVYAREGASNGRCRTCGAEVSVQDRRAWLDETVRGHAFRAKHLADAFRINVNTIRSWHLRGKLWPAPNPDVFQPSRVEDLWYDADKPLFLVGEVLELARQDAERRAANEAKRAQREDVAA